MSQGKKYSCECVGAFDYIHTLGRMLNNRFEGKPVGFPPEDLEDEIKYAIDKYLKCFPRSPKEFEDTPEAKTAIDLVMYVKKQIEEGNELTKQDAVILQEAPGPSCD